MVNIALIPIDNRPVCYTLPEQISKIDSNIQLFMPPREMLGDLKKIADYVTDSVDNDGVVKAVGKFIGI